MSGTLSIGGKEIYSHSDATDKVTYGSGIPAGSLIQTQNYTYTADDYYITSTSSNSFTVFSNGSTNFEYSITPKFPTSKILVQIMAGIGKSAGSAHIALYRDDVKLDAATGDQAGSYRLRSTAVLRPNDDSTDSTYGLYNVFIQYLDSPTIPSAPTSIKYDIRACLGSAYSGTIYLNRSNYNTDINYSARSISTIILQEIAQ